MVEAGVSGSTTAKDSLRNLNESVNVPGTRQNIPLQRRHVASGGRRVNAKNLQYVALAARQCEGIESANTAGHAAGHAEKQTANAAGRDDAAAAMRRGAPMIYPH